MQNEQTKLIICNLTLFIWISVFLLHIDFEL